MPDILTNEDVSFAGQWPLPQPRVRRRSETSSGEFSPSDGGAQRAREVTGELPILYLAPALAGPNRLFKFRGTFVIEVSHLDESTVYASHRDLPVSGYGGDMEEAIKSFAEMLEVQWAALVEEDVERLTDGARQARARLQAAVHVLPR